MSEIFLIGDTHFGHPLMMTLREFPTVEAMDEEMISRWNSVVRPHDKVYHLGDVVMRTKSFPLIARLNGTKRLIRGNHDIYRTRKYLEYFKEIYGVRILDKLCLSHIPIHPNSLPRYASNAHGHLHANSLPDPRYLCLSWERLGGIPITLGEARTRLIMQGGEK